MSFNKQPVLHTCSRTGMSGMARYPVYRGMKCSLCFKCFNKHGKVIKELPYPVATKKQEAQRRYFNALGNIARYKGLLVMGDSIGLTSTEVSIIQAILDEAKLRVGLRYLKEKESVK